jgi:hypothetical protein
MVLGALMILVGTGFTANEKPVTVNKANANTVNQSDKCCEGTPVNCETGKPCTPEEIEKCKARCENMGANATGISAETSGLIAHGQAGHQYSTAKISNTNSTQVNAMTVGHKDDCCEGGTPINCETGKKCTPEEMAKCKTSCENRKGNATGIAAKQCSSAKDCQSKSCDKKGSI